MKKVSLIIVALFVLSYSYAQEFKIAVSDKNGKFTINVHDCDLQIIGHDGNEILITAKGYEKPPERAKGLKPLYNSAVDNTGIGLSVQESGGNLTIQKATRGDIDYTIKIPSTMHVSISETNWHGDNFTIENISGEIEVNAKSSDIKMKGVSGPVVANTTNGDIDIVYKTLNQEKPNAIKSINGHVDITLPSSAKSSVKLRAMNGEIFTNFDVAMKTSEDNINVYGGGKIEGAINGGGVEIKLNTINDNIYLRKAE